MCLMNPQRRLNKSLVLCRVPQLKRGIKAIPLILGGEILLLPLGYGVAMAAVTLEPSLEKKPHWCIVLLKIENQDFLSSISFPLAFLLLSNPMNAKLKLGYILCTLHKK